MRIEYEVKRGKEAGMVLSPHKYKDGRYVVCKSNKREDYVRVDTLEEVLEHIKQGYRVQMGGKGRAPSLISADRLTVLDG